MNLDEIIMYNQNYDIESKVLKDRLSSMTQSIININKNIDLDEFRQLSYPKAQEIYYSIKKNMDFEQNHELYGVLEQIKETEYPQLKIAHYYPVINDMDFLDNNQKKDLDKYLKGMFDRYIYTESSVWDNLDFNKKIEEKILTFLLDKGIIEKVYIIKCGCHSSDCDGKRISQERYDEFVKYHSLTPDDTANMSDEEICNLEFKGYIEVGCWNDGGKEIYDLDTFMKEVRVFAYKNVMKPDLSLDLI